MNTSVLRTGLRSVHPAGVVGQEPLYQTPLLRKELQQHQVKVRIWKK